MAQLPEEAPPQLSVVIASLNGRPYIDDCLEALHGQQGNIRAEVIVVDCVGATVTDFVSETYPRVTLKAFQGQQSVQALRSVGILAATGSIIAITEDHCLPSSNWFQSLVNAHRSNDHLAIGGAVDNAATSRIVDLAAFFCEYSAYLNPVPKGVVHDLPGPNVSYKREAFEIVGDILADGYQETFLHQHLEAQGYELWSDPALMVGHKKHFTMAGFMHERFHYGRWFAGTRNATITLAQRSLYLLLSPVLPFMLAVRLSRRVMGHPQYYRDFVKAFPVLLVFLMVWAAGEWTGYAFGPGDSVLKIS